jgi:hypothetical protein
MSNFLPHVLDAVAAWHSRQPKGRTLLPKQASQEIQAMFDNLPAGTGCGRITISAILRERHGWVKSGRLITLPRPAPVSMPAKTAEMLAKLPKITEEEMNSPDFLI